MTDLDTQMTLPCLRESGDVAKDLAKRQVADALGELAALYAEDYRLPPDMTVHGPLGLIRVRFHHGKGRS